MDLTRFGAWRPLALVFGLIVSPSVFAQQVGAFSTKSIAANACNNALYSWLDRGQYTTNAMACVISACSFNEVSSRYTLTLGRSWQGAACAQSSDVSDFFNTSSIPYSGRQPNTFQSSNYFFSFLEDDDPEPSDCSSASPYTLTIPEGGMVGGGFYNVCTAGCSFTGKMGYVGTYPAGNIVVNYTPTGSTCDPDDEEPEPDLPSDDPLDLPPEDGGVDPGYDPGDGTPGSSGGSTCDQAPSCTGDSLQCNILFQQWMTRCDAEQISTDASGQRDEIIEGLTGVRDGVDGLVDGIDRIGDGVDGLVGGIDRIGDGVDDVNTKLDGTNQRLDIIGGSLDGIGDGVDGLGDRLGDIFGDGPVGDDWLGGMTTRDVVLDSSSLDDSGMGLSRTCPAVLTNSTSFSFFGNSYTLKFEMFCAMLELVGQLLVVLAAFVGVRILLKSATG